MPSLEDAREAARILQAHAYVRVVARADADALLAVTLLGHALRRAHRDFHVSWLPRLDEAAAAGLSEEKNDALVLVGLGGDAAARPLASNTVALDVETPAEADVALSQASLAPLAHLVATALLPRNADLALLATAGTIARRAHVARKAGGLDDAVPRDAAEAGLLRAEHRLSLRGPSLLLAISQLDEPVLDGVTGRARQAKKWLVDAGLSPDAHPHQLKDDDAERLGSLLAARALQQDLPDHALDALMRPAPRALKGPHAGHDAADLAMLAEAAIALGRPGLGLAAAWPDQRALHELREAESGLRDDLVAALLRADRGARREGPFVATDTARAALCAPLADRLALGAPGALAHATHEGRAIVAARMYGRADVAAKAAVAAREAGGTAWGDHDRARIDVPAAELERVVKLLAEALA